MVNAHRVLTEEEIAILRLIRTPGIGPVSFNSLIELYPSAVKAVNDLPDLCARRKRKVLTPPTKEEIIQEYEKLTALGGQFVFSHDDCYPPLLKHIHDAPPVLSVVGDITTLAGKSFGIVGTRNSSAGNCNFTEDIATFLVKEGFVITSGMAKGIDTAAHKGTMNAGGKTIAVLAGGVDFIYPPENENLYQKIIENGCVISEMPLGMQPLATHFPRRNRIISGISLGIAVMEAQKRSGSLITANCALEQGREVFAVPGSPRDARAGGPNYLIKQGAHILETAEDIIDNLPDIFTPPMNQETHQPKLDIAEIIEEEVVVEVEDTQTIQSLTNLLSSTPTNIDTLVRQSGLTQAEVNIELTQLDMEGKIERHPGGGVSLL
jgi:DNA processing protein